MSSKQNVLDWDMLRHGDWTDNTASERMYDAGGFAPKSGTLVAANQVQAVTYSSLSHSPTNFLVRCVKSSVGILIVYKMDISQQRHLVGGAFSFAARWAYLESKFVRESLILEHEDVWHR